MNPYLQMFVTILCSVLASSGLWAYIQKRLDRRDAKTKMILGLAHDRIITLGMGYIKRGWISSDEFEDLKKYLYDPYRELGGNGTAERIMNEVGKLPLRNMEDE